MKKGLLVILIALFAMSNVNAQFSLGGGATMFSDVTGFELRVNYAVNDQISVVPFFDSFSGISMYGLDGHYSLGDPEAFDFYPLLGLNMISFSGSSHTGFEAGGGLTYSLSDNLKLYGELRYINHVYGATAISAGILYQL